MAKEKKVREKEEEDNNDDEKSTDSSGRSSSDYRQQRSSRNFRRYNRQQRQTVPAYIDWKDVDYLARFVPERGKIMPRRISGISAKDQRRLARAIKRARVMALLPFVSD